MKYTSAYINNLSEDEQIKLINKEGTYLIDFIKNPSEKVKLAIVKKNGYSIWVFGVPFEILGNGYVQDYICSDKYNDPSEEIQIAAVKNIGYAIKYIKNPSEIVKLEAIKNRASAIQHIKDPSEELQLEAIKQDPDAMEYLRKYITAPKALILLDKLNNIRNIIK